MDSIEGNDDFLITCAGFEERSLGVIDKLSNYSCKDAFLIKYEATVDTPSHKTNEEKALSKLSEFGKVTEIMLDPLNPLPALTSLFTSMGNVDTDKVSLTIDISTMSKYVLLVLLKFLTQKKIIQKTRFLYTEPKNYVDKNRTPLSFGTANFETVPTFEGMHNPKALTLLILMLGFEGDRAYAIYERQEPDKCYLTIPNPPYKAEWGNRTYKSNLALINAVGKDNVINVHSKNPILVMNSLESIVNEADPKHEMNCIIVPMGTKPQTVGAFLYYWKSSFYPSLMYSYPKKHSSFSEGIDVTYSLPICSL